MRLEISPALFSRELEPMLVHIRTSALSTVFQFCSGSGPQNRRGDNIFDSDELAQATGGNPRLRMLKVESRHKQQIFMHWQSLHAGSLSRKTVHQLQYVATQSTPSPIELVRPNGDHVYDTQSAAPSHLASEIDAVVAPFALAASNVP